MLKLVPGAGAGTQGPVAILHWPVEVLSVAQYCREGEADPWLHSHMSNKCAAETNEPGTVMKRSHFLPSWK